MHHAIHYIVEGSGIPLLFMHGLGGDLQQSEQLLRPVEGVKKILADCPGHGKNGAVGGSPLSFDYMSDQLLALMDQLEIQQFLVGGISMGAGISVNLMVRYPERIMGAVLVRPAWLDRPLPDNLSILLKVADCITQPDGLVSYTALPEFKELERTLPHAAASLLGQFQRPQGAAATASLLRAMIADAPLKTLGVLHAFEKPCCIIINQSDPLHPAGFGEELHRHLAPSSLYTVFPRYVDAARHHEEVQHTIRAWLAPLRNR